MFDKNETKRSTLPSILPSILPSTVSESDCPMTLRILQEILKKQESISLLDESTGRDDGTHINSMIEAFFKHNKDEINKHVKLNQDHSKHKGFGLKASQIYYDDFRVDKFALALKIHAEFIGAEEFEKMLCKPSFSFRALNALKNIDPPKIDNNFVKNLILFDPILLEEYMRHRKKLHYQSLRETDLD